MVKFGDLSFHCHAVPISIVLRIASRNMQRNTIKRRLLLWNGLLKRIYRIRSVAIFQGKIGELFFQDGLILLKTER